MWNTPSKQRLAQLPRLYATETISAQQKQVYLHFFTSGYDWYALEYDGEDVFFGFVVCSDYCSAEWGYFSFSELKELCVFGMYEVDCEPEEYWQIRPTCEVDKICQAMGWQETA